MANVHKADETAAMLPIVGPADGARSHPIEGPCLRIPRRAASRRKECIIFFSRTKQRASTARGARNMLFRLVFIRLFCWFAAGIGAPPRRLSARPRPVGEPSVGPQLLAKQASAQVNRVWLWRLLRGLDSLNLIEDCRASCRMSSYPNSLGHPPSRRIERVSQTGISGAYSRQGWSDLRIGDPIGRSW
jgi:hypothetical protein